VILGIFLKDREASLEGDRFEVKIDKMEAIYAVAALGSEKPRVSFEDYITTADILLKRDEENMIILEFEEFVPPGRIRELRLISDELTLSVTLDEKETEEIAEGFRDHQPPEDFLSYLKRNMKKSENPLMMANLEQVSS